MKLIDGANLPDRDAMLLSFVVRNQGDVSSQAYDRLRKLARNRWNIEQDAEFTAALANAFSCVDAQNSCLFLCQGRSCRRQKRFDESREALEKYAAAYGIPIVTTTCHGPCKQAPISSLRVAGEWQMFSQFHEQQDWHSIIEYCQQAVASNKLLGNAGAAQAFRYDPAQGDKPSIALAPLMFLLGEYTGKNKAGFAASYPQLHKVKGQLEAGGRYLSLRLETLLFIDPSKPYSLASTLVIGVNEDNGLLEAWGFTNGGTRQHLAVSLDDGKVIFQDKSPGKDGNSSSRRIMIADDNGWEERLEYNSGAGFNPYSILKVRPLARKKARPAQGNDDVHAAQSIR